MLPFLSSSFFLGGGERGMQSPIKWYKKKKEKEKKKKNVDRRETAVY